MSTDGPPNEPTREQPTDPMPPTEPPTEPPTAPMPPDPGYAAPPPSQPLPPPPGAPPTIPPRYPAPPSLQPPPGGPGQFILGAAIGLIPLILAMIGLGSIFNGSNPIFGYFLTAGAIGLPIALILSIILTIINSTRRVGLGMLVATVVSPIIFFISCLVVLTHPVV